MAGLSPFAPRKSRYFRGAKGDIYCLTAPYDRTRAFAGLISGTSATAVGRPAGGNEAAEAVFFCRLATSEWLPATGSSCRRAGNTGRRASACRSHRLGGLRRSLAANPPGGGIWLSVACSSIMAKVRSWTSALSRVLSSTERLLVERRLVATGAPIQSYRSPHSFWIVHRNRRISATSSAQQAQAVCEKQVHPMWLCHASALSGGDVAYRTWGDGIKMCHEALLTGGSNRVILGSGSGIARKSHPAGPTRCCPPKSPARQAVL